MIDEQEFLKHADHALDRLNRALIDAGDDYGFETDFNSGALTIEVEAPPTKFVVSPNTPVRQVWVSARSKSFKLDWDHVQSAFIYGETGETLKQLIASKLSDQLGEEIIL
jgi:CyaY protein